MWTPVVARLRRLAGAFETHSRRNSERLWRRPTGVRLRLDESVPDGSPDIAITRDDVAHGDDDFAPHLLHVSTHEHATMRELARFLRAQEYLPPIGRGRATWVLKGSINLAVVAQEWVEPRWLIDADSPVLKLGAAFHFRSEKQADPDATFESLRIAG